MNKRSDIAALVGSRICHDLISPIGAIGNGLELLTLSGATANPEMSLISESAENANARIRFFRIAYGAAPVGQTVGRSETLAILRASAMSGRISFAWDAEGEVARADLRIIFLVFQCFESALPRGGEVHVTEREGHWIIQAKSDRIKPLPDLWGAVTDSRSRTDVTAAQVQFVLLPDAAKDAGRTLSLDIQDDRITLRF